MTWQPIKTAPKNKKILLGYHNYYGHWRTVCGQWFTEEQIEEWDNSDHPAGWYETSANAEDDPTCWLIEPTHWMPLPPPPPPDRRDASRSRATLLAVSEYLKARPPVRLLHNNETGFWLWSVEVIGSDGFWLDSFEAEAEARAYCNQHNLPIREAVLFGDSTVR